MLLRKRVKSRLLSYERIAVWGAGGLGKTAYKYWLPQYKVKFFVDSNEILAKKFIKNCPILSPESVDFLDIDLVIICTSAQISALSHLEALQYKGEVIYIYELFLPSGDFKSTHIESLLIDIAATKNTSWIKFLILKPQIIINITYRLANWARESKWSFILYLLIAPIHYFFCLVLSIQLPLKTIIGPGLIFAHYGTIVFTERAKIGAFFTIYHGCTVGTNDSGIGPIIGDFVTQYAGSHILGRCNIGGMSRVGANAVVLDLECPNKTSLVGVPARVILYKRID
jgi:serine O-acetyltransferase